MATDLEDALLILKKAHPDEVRIIHFPDGRTQIEITPHQQETIPAGRRGRWAEVADDLARENLFGQDLGDKVRASIREFRDEFEFRDVFSSRRKQ
jgi:hypothetical protein